MNRLDGKVALVTGASRGQGAVEASLFAAEGASVVVADVLDDEGRAVADSIGERAFYVHLDVTSEADWDGAVKEATSRLGRLDVLVNNAGILRFGPIAATSADDYMAVVNVNQLGTFLGMRAVFEPMAAAGGGSIVNISSIDGLIGMAGMVSYVASKFAVRGMTKVAALEFAAAGIRVNSVHPGGVATPMVDEASAGLGFDVGSLLGAVPLGRIASSEEIARLVLFLASDDSSYCTGSEFVVDGGWTAGYALAPPQG